MRLSTYFAAFVFASAALGLVNYTIQGAVAALDKATAHQCATHDWPAGKAAATKAWCIDNGYSVDKR